MATEQVEKYKELIFTQAIGYAPKVLAAIVTLLVGLWLASAVTGLVRRALALNKVDETLTPFLCSLLSWLLKAVVFISVASMLGITTTSFVAILGAAGLAVGLALQGSLSNFAGGVLILIFRPYKVGDVIEVMGVVGTVREIQVFTTILVSEQGRKVVIPNGPLSNGMIKNFSAEPYVRCDTVVRVPHDTDLDQAKDLLKSMLPSIPGVLAEPAPIVAVSDIGGGTVGLVVRPFCASKDLGAVTSATVEGTKKTLDAAKIEIR